MQLPGFYHSNIASADSPKWVNHGKGEREGVGKPWFIIPFLSLSPSIPTYLPHPHLLIYIPFLPPLLLPLLSNRLDSYFLLLKQTLVGYLLVQPIHLYVCCYWCLGLKGFLGSKKCFKYMWPMSWVIHFLFSLNKKTPNIHIPIQVIKRKSFGPDPLPQ